MQDLVHWLYDSWPSHMITDYRWSWPIAESLHFIGLGLMTGTVGAFDLRLLGFAKGVRPADLHRLLRYGMVGFAISVVTGLWFITGAPDQYFYNHAFHFKVATLLAIGINVALFYRYEFAGVLALGPGDEAPRRAKIMAGLSLVLLAAVILFGRMLTFFRPVSTNF